MNPISTRKQLKEIDLTQQNNFPLFIHELSVKKFREIKDLTIRLNHPVSVLSGTNKIGKTSLLSMLACSHVEFQMRSNTTGIFERCTWSRLVKFSNHDIQNEDWEYSIKFKNGNKVETKIGRRLLATKKWSGVAKRESQIGNKKVIFIDLDRISPARSFSASIKKLKMYLSASFTNMLFHKLTSGVRRPSKSTVCKTDKSNFWAKSISSGP